MDQNTTVDRLVRMLDEERNDRIDSSSNLQDATKLMDVLREENARFVRVLAEERDYSNRLYQRNAELVTAVEQRWTTIQRLERELVVQRQMPQWDKEDADQLITVLAVQLPEMHGLVASHTDERGIHKIPIIKEIRVLTGLGLKLSKSVVDRYLEIQEQKRIDKENAEEIIAREDAGTFDEEEVR